MNFLKRMGAKILRKKAADAVENNETLSKAIDTVQKIKTLKIRLIIIGVSFAVFVIFFCVFSFAIDDGWFDDDGESSSTAYDNAFQSSVCESDAAKLVAMIIYNEVGTTDLFTQLSAASIVLNNAGGNSYEEIHSLTDNNYQGFSSYKDSSFEDVVPEDYQGKMLYIAEMVLSGKYTLPNNLHLQADSSIATSYGTIWTYTPAHPYDVYFAYVGDEGLEDTDVFGNTLPEEAYSDVESSVNYYKELAASLELDDYSDYTVDSVCVSTIYMSSVYSDCKSIMVDGVSYTLDEYVAGVVSGEAYTGESMEALKAQAIAARTYAIFVTNNCSSSIGNSDSFQVFDSNFDDRAIQAANETSGMVLVYNGSMFKSEYDSFCYQDKDCPDCTCDSEFCSVTYSKLPNSEKHVISIPVSYKGFFVPDGGHARGMSQLMSYYLASAKGYNYNKLLNYFYSDGVQIASLTNDKDTSSSIPGFVPQTTAPLDESNTYYFSSNNIFYPKFRSECTWYAYGRFNETLNLIGSSKKQTVHGHAKFWYDENTVFPSSNDITKPKVGAIIVWESDQFGHVAIVEAVNSDGTIDYSEANQAKTEENPDGFKYNSHVKLTSENGEFSIEHRRSGYSFVGYIYPE